MKLDVQASFMEESFRLSGRRIASRDFDLQEIPDVLELLVGVLVRKTIIPSR